MNRLFLFSISWFSAMATIGQVPVSDFSAPANACLNQQIKLVNASTNAIRYEWDFCANDSETLTSNADLATLSGLSGGYGYEIAEDAGTWFGFAVSQNNHSIYRLDFGDSPQNVPAITNLGNPGSQLSFPQGIELYKHNGNWYGFIGLYDPGSGIVRLDFGSSLTNIPTADNLGMFGLSGRFWDLKVVNQNGDLILVIINRNTNSIVRVNYRDSFNNEIVNATHVFSSSIAGANLTPGFDIVQAGTDWIALVASDQTNSIIKLKFTGDILTAPAIDGTYTTNLTRPLQVSLLKEGTHYVAAITSEFTSIKLVDYHDLDAANAPSEIIHSGLPSLFAADVLRYHGKSILQGVGSTNKLRNVSFQSSCGASVDFSEEENPEDLIFSSA
ncbi:MAG: hypothetical protein L0Y35_09385 [Flammeovirgaceae bacterium]|nr:hypothetical protein [Flammeovirgaceae bacterium]